MKPQSYVYQTYCALLERFAVGDKITLHDLVDAPGSVLGHYGSDVQERQRVSAALSDLHRFGVVERLSYRIGKQRAFRVTWLSQDWSPRDRAVGLGCRRHRQCRKTNAPATDEVQRPTEEPATEEQAAHQDILAALDLAQELIEEVRAAIWERENE